MFKTPDGTYSYPEIVALRCIITYSQYIVFNGYEVLEHEKRDTVVEEWLAGIIKLAMNTKEAENMLRKYKERDDYVR